MAFLYPGDARVYCDHEVEEGFRLRGCDDPAWAAWACFATDDTRTDEQQTQDADLMSANDMIEQWLDDGLDGRSAAPCASPRSQDWLVAGLVAEDNTADATCVVPQHDLVIRIENPMPSDEPHGEDAASGGGEDVQSLGRAWLFDTEPAADLVACAHACAGERISSDDGQLDGWDSGVKYHDSECGDDEMEDVTEANGGGDSTENQDDQLRVDAQQDSNTDSDETVTAHRHRAHPLDLESETDATVCDADPAGHRVTSSTGRAAQKRRRRASPSPDSSDAEELLTEQAPSRRHPRRRRRRRRGRGGF